MTELNNKEYRVKVTGPFTFTIGVDTSGFKPYVKGGQVQQIKEKVGMKFTNLKESFADPDYMKVLITDESKDYRYLYVLIYQALLKFQEQNHGKTPRPYNEEDAQAVLNLVNHFNSESKNKLEKINEQVVKNVAYTAHGELNPMCCFFGGIIAQEVIKAASGKFTPIPQFFCFDSLECLPEKSLQKKKFVEFFFSFFFHLMLCPSSTALSANDVQGGVHSLGCACGNLAFKFSDVMTPEQELPGQV